MAKAAEARRLGVFYTPDRLAEALTRWALADGATRILDPSCGDGRFLLAAATELNGRDFVATGIDVDDEAVRQLVARRVPGLRIHHGSFFAPGTTEKLKGPFDAVAGNPPYVRHHWQSKSIRDQARALLTVSGVTLSRQADLWAYFVILAAQQVALDGRLALILPVASTHADYSHEVWEFLKRNFGSVEMIVLQDRAFEQAREQVVLLLASRRGGSTDVVPSFLAAGLADVEDRLRDRGRPSTSAASPAGIAEWKWNLLSSEARQLWSELTRDRAVSALERCASVRIGSVTGANGFFVRSHDDPILGAEGVSAAPILTSSRALDVVTWRKQDEHDSRSSPGRGELLTLDPDLTPSGELASLLREGVRDGLPDRHHCSLREPWWSLTDLQAPDVFLGYMGTTPHRLVRNLAGTLCTNAIHRIDWLRPRSRRGAVVSSWTSLFALSAELRGRHYGGGVLKIEPAAAKQLPLLPTAELGEVLEELDLIRRSRGPSAAERLADEAMCKSTGATAGDVRLLADAAATLRAARTRR